METNNKTFEKIGVHFTSDNCLTCQNNTCHNQVKSLKDDIEYSVHITADFDNNYYRILACESANSFSQFDIEATFRKEHDAVEFLCKTFERFKCL